MQGINAAGLAVVGEAPVVGLTATLGAAESASAIRGITAAGYRVRAPNVDGVSGAIGMMRTTDLRGLSIAGYNEVKGVQLGVTIGVYNSAEVLNGVQIGLLNRAKNNAPSFRWLPLINAHF